MGRSVDAGGERREVVVAAETGRADSILAAALPALSRAQLQRLIRDGKVRLNGEPLKKSAQVEVGQSLLVHLPDIISDFGPAPDLPLPVLYEDEDVVVIDKPAGIIVHPAPGDTGPTVTGWFAERYPDAVASLEPLRPGVAHRLDRETTGVLVLGKSPEAVEALSRAFESRSTEKTYIALCEGIPAKEHAVIDAPIGRHPGDRGRMAVVRDGSGRESRTEYELLGSDGDRSLLVVHPESGRTHQVRVHLAAIGIPVIFDPVYGAPGEGRQQLHAARLALPHPTGGSLTAFATLPADMAAIVRSMGLATVASEYLQPSSASRSLESA